MLLHIFTKSQLQQVQNARDYYRLEKKKKNCLIFFSIYKQDAPEKKLILAFCELLNNLVYHFTYNFKQTCFQTHSKTLRAKVES